MGIFSSITGPLSRAASKLPQGVQDLGMGVYGVGSAYVGAAKKSVKPIATAVGLTTAVGGGAAVGGAVLAKRAAVNVIDKTAHGVSRPFFRLQRFINRFPVFSFAAGLGAAGGLVLMHYRNKANDARDAMAQQNAFNAAVLQDPTLAARMGVSYKNTVSPAEAAQLEANFRQSAPGQPGHGDAVLKERANAAAQQPQA